MIKCRANISPKKPSPISVSYLPAWLHMIKIYYCMCYGHGAIFLRGFYGSRVSNLLENWYRTIFQRKIHKIFSNTRATKSNNYFPISNQHKWVVWYKKNVFYANFQLIITVIATLTRFSSIRSLKKKKETHSIWLCIFPVDSAGFHRHTISWLTQPRKLPRPSHYCYHYYKQENRI